MVHPHMVIELPHAFCALAIPVAAVVNTMADMANRHKVIFIVFHLLAVCGQVVALWSANSHQRRLGADSLKSLKS